MTPAEIKAELDRLHPAAFGWALACCRRDREDALDVLQTSYLKVLDGRAKFAGHSSFKTFLFGVIRHSASEVRRSNALRSLFLANRGGGRSEPSPSAAPREDRLMLLSVLARLSRRQRQLLELVFYLGLTVEEAAETLGISVGSARVHYERGKKRLAALLEVRGSGRRNG
jgi:RNA polymerase sigma-70 factor (ECF subfamily)